MSTTAANPPSLEHLRLLLDSTAQCLYTVDLAGRCTYANRAAEAALGYGPSELLGREMHAAIHHSYPGGSPYPLVNCPICRALWAGVSHQAGTDTFWRRDGSPLPVEHTAYPMVDAQGNLQGAVIAFSDITLRQQWDEERNQQLQEQTAPARESTQLSLESQLLAQVFTIAPDPIVISDLNARIVDLNPAFTAVFGWEKEQVLGKSLFWLEGQDPETPSFPAELRERIRQIGAGAPVPPREIQAATRRGEPRQLLVSSRLLRDPWGRPVGWMTVAKDITELKRAQERLQSSLHQLELVNAVGNAVAGAEGQQAVMDDVVQTLCDHGGFTAARILTLSPGASCLELRAQRGPGDYPEEPRIPLGQRLAGRVAQQGHDEVESLRAAASWQHGNPVEPGSPGASGAELAVPLFSGDRVVAVLAVVSQEVEAFDAAQRAALTAIGRRVALGLERARLHEEVQIKNEEMEAFLYAASHDLRSPLVNVMGFSQELATTLIELREWTGDSGLDPESRSYLEGVWSRDVEPALHYIGSSVKKMEALVDGLLQLSRIGSQPLKYEEVRVEELLQEIVESMWTEVAASHAAIRFAPLPPVRADRNRLAQVFSNLLGNAIKYLDPNRPGEVQVSGEVRQGRCRYCVADNGIGIPPQFHEQVFRPFHRVAPGSRSGETSVGLGLSIVERIIRRHRGRVWLESEPGRGSRFCVELPQHPEL